MMCTAWGLRRRRACMHRCWVHTFYGHARSLFLLNSDAEDGVGHFSKADVAEVHPNWVSDAPASPRGACLCDQRVCVDAREIYDVCERGSEREGTYVL